MTNEQLDDLIELRRALAEPARSAARVGEDGLVLQLVLPDDGSWWLEVSQLDPDSSASHGVGQGSPFEGDAGRGSTPKDGAERVATPESEVWQVVEVSLSPAPLGIRRGVTATADAMQIVQVVDREYRRLLLERRNAACGTPTRD